MIELDPNTGKPLKEKISKLTVILDKSMGGTELAEVNFNMTDFYLNEYKTHKLFLKKLPTNTEYPIDSENTFIDLGIKGVLKN